MNLRDFNDFNQSQLRRCRRRHPEPSRRSREVQSSCLAVSLKVLKFRQKVLKNAKKLSARLPYIRCLREGTHSPCLALTPSTLSSRDLRDHQLHPLSEKKELLFLYDLLSNLLKKRRKQNSDNEGSW